MFETITDEEQRGQVGIGTLIVFIAMVLVAAIAAGVLINTAGFLQSQAEATGQESTDLVSERIEVGEAVGIVGNDDSEVKSIKVNVKAAPGADEIDLGSTTIQAVGPNGQANLVFNDTDADGTDLSGNTFSESTALDLRQGEFIIVGEDGSILSETDAVLGSQDTFTLVVNPKAEPFGNKSTVTTGQTTDTANVSAFGQGQQATLDIVSPASATTQVELRAPDLFGSTDEAVRL
jgi:flagellin FlaB